MLLLVKVFIKIVLFVNIFLGNKRPFGQNKPIGNKKEEKMVENPENFHYKVCEFLNNLYYLY